MQKKIYSVPVKAAAVVLLLLSFVGAGISGFYGALAAFAGCYNTESYQPENSYGSTMCWNAISKYAERANDWYQLSKNQDSFGYSEREHFQYLTETLQDTSLCFVQVNEKSGISERIPIAGKELNSFCTKITYYLMEKSDDEESGFEVYVDESSGVNDVFKQMRITYENMYPDRWSYFIWIAVSALIGLASWIFLLVVSGHSAETGEIAWKGFHRIPFDLLTVLFVLIGCIPCATFAPYWPAEASFLRMYVALVVIAVLSIVLMVMLWVHTLTARIKAKKLLRSTLIGMLCIKVWGILRSSAQKLAESGSKPKVNRQKVVPQDGDESPENIWKTTRDHLKKIDWRHNKVTAALAAMGRGIRAAIRGLAELLRNLNVIWKLCGVVALIVAGLEFLAMAARYDGGILLCLMLLDVLVLLAVGFFAMQLDRLKKGGERLADGDLDYKVPTDHMYWDLQQHAKNLNAISDGMASAVEERLKSERMKYELLTNVSHDIKTPLTSIINYVDLLRGEPVESKQAQEYIEVLERQSAKLKKLITDLIEVSKATTGNITVNSERTHAGELLRQCVGEYSERFAAQELQPILTVPEDEPSIYADGRLLWRVFDNLLGNIVKYALPGTRVYIDLESTGNQVVISLKNISREQLSISSDELMERFVRGDASRATEGSGLGLSIARSLTELMQGRFGLIVDGDLFKIVLNFEKMAD